MSKMNNINIISNRRRANSLLALCVLFPLLLQAQSPIRSDTLIIPFTVESKQMLQSISSKNSLVRPSAFQIKDGDFLLNYNLALLDDNFSYHIKFRLMDAHNEPVMPIPEQVTGETMTITASQNKVRETFIWRNILEENIYYYQPYQLEVCYELFGSGIDCKFPPIFSYKFKDKQAQYITGIAGVLMIGLGSTFKNNYREAYQEYEFSWQNGERKFVGDQGLQRANDIKRAHDILFFGGIIVLGVDVAIYLYQRFIKHRRKVKQFKKYCPERINQRLKLSTSSNNPLGIGLTLTF